MISLTLLQWTYVCFEWHVLIRIFIEVPNPRVRVVFGLCVECACAQARVDATQARLLHNFETMSNMLDDLEARCDMSDADMAFLEGLRRDACGECGVFSYRWK